MNLIPYIKRHLPNPLYYSECDKIFRSTIILSTDKLKVWFIASICKSTENRRVYLSFFYKIIEWCILVI